MEGASVVQKGHNPSCGDDLVLYLKWNDEVLEDVSFEGFGCALSQSGASMLTAKIKGMAKLEILKMEERDMYELFGTVISPSREKCALLAINILKDALRVL